MINNKYFLLRNYWRILLEVDDSFNLLKNKYNEISDDLSSSRENPSCECGKRVINFLNEKYIADDESKKFIEELFDINEVKVLVSGLEEERVNYENEEKNVLTQVYKVGLKSEDWRNFYDLVNEKNINFKNFSVLQKDDHLEVRFL